MNLKTQKILSLIFVLAMFFLSGCSSTPKFADSNYYPAYQPSYNSAPIIPAKAPSAITTMLPAPSGPLRDIYHEVGPSETLWRISTIYSVDQQTIMKANNLRDATQIKSGMKLLIPNTRGPRPNIPLYPTTRWTHIVIHHTVTDEGTAYTIDGLHHQRGWENGMGYHFLIDNGTRGKALGQIEVGPRWIKQMQGAHVKVGEWNQKSIGIAVVGNYSATGLPDKMLESLVFLVTTLKGFYHISDKNILGHRDVQGAATECPGKYFPWSEFKRKIKMY